MKVVLLCVVIAMSLLIILGLIYAITWLRKEWVLIKVNSDKGVFKILGLRRFFKIVKDNRYVFTVKNGQIVSVRDWHRFFGFAKYGGK